MFIGHYAVGFALKKAEPKMSLGILILGAAMLDFLFAIFLLSGVEHMRFVPDVIGFLSFDLYDLPVSHSMAGAGLWSLAGFLAYRIWPGGDGVSRKRQALIFAAAIFSHFVLDVIVHQPDLPLLTNDSPKIGLSLWQSIPATVAVELGLLLTGAVLYVRATVSRTSWGDYGLLFIVLFQAAYFIGCYLGLLPHSSQELGARLIIEQFGLCCAAEWIDRNRTPVYETVNK